MKKLVLLLFTVAGVAFVFEPTARAGVHFAFGFPIPFPVFYGPAYPYYGYYPGYVYYGGYYGNYGRGYYGRGYYGRGYYGRGYYGRGYYGRAYYRNR
ncbi:MAG TPA: hypothetical protein VE860_00825 [Chthoniobacterales bacterium]|jgi:hypothetical protein|nr:hypothetical protein [Chthoniobacterales bacterium]